MHFVYEKTVVVMLRYVWNLIIRLAPLTSTGGFMARETVSPLES